MRFARGFFILVVLLCCLETVRLWFLAPQSMASHFDVLGNPDAFVSKYEFFSLQVQTSLVVLLVSLALQIFPLSVPPSWVNMPNREYWLASPDRRESVSDRLSSFGSALSALILLVMQAGFELSFSANLQRPVVFAAQLMVPVIVGFFLLSFLLLFQLGRSFRQPDHGQASQTGARKV